MLNDVIGQKGLKKNIEIAIVASKNRQTAMGHVLLSGAGGLGKTHVLNSICSELGYCRAITQGNRLTHKTLTQFLVDACKKAQEQFVPAFIIIDEIHEMPLDVQEELFYPIDNNQILMAGEPISLGPFTLAGATTCPEELDGKSLINRFTYHWKLEELSETDLIFIISDVLFKENVSADLLSMRSIASKSRGIPRLAIKYAKRATDYAHYEKRTSLSQEDVKRTFDEFGIDALGLDEQQRQYLTILRESVKPMGIDVLAGRLGELRPEQVRKIVEPYLWRLGLISTSSRGRELTPKGIEYLTQ